MKAKSEVILSTIRSLSDSLNSLHQSLGEMTLELESKQLEGDKSRDVTGLAHLAGAGFYIGGSIVCIQAAVEMLELYTDEMPRVHNTSEQEILFTSLYDVLFRQWLLIHQAQPFTMLSLWKESTHGLFVKVVGLARELC